MNIKTDLHTHTIASTHAYSTVMENARAAQEYGLEAIAITDHAPGMPDAPHLWHFDNLNTIPKTLYGVRILIGAECTYQNEAGELDIPEGILNGLDIVIGSLHPPVYVPQTAEESTRLWLKAIDNPYIDILGHMDRSGFAHVPDFDEVVSCAVKKDKIVEFNVHSLDFGEETRANTRKMLEACKKYKAKIAVNSDAHFCTYIGKFDAGIKMLEEVRIDEEFIVNLDFNKFSDYIYLKKGKRL
ncbi:MAG: phosphatase [Clostridia bacterium]|nr:phosphatase [Clostridia bacterium]